MREVLLQALNDKGESIGALTMAAVHEKNLLHPAIHILVDDDEGRIFVRRRAHTKKLYPGVLSTSVGAHILYDWTAEETATENLHKFLGLDLPLENIGEARVKDDFENEQITVFVCHANEIKELNPEQSDEGSFMSVGEIERLIAEKQTTPHLAAALELWKKQKSKVTS